MLSIVIGMLAVGLALLMCYTAGYIFLILLSEPVDDPVECIVDGGRFIVLILIALGVLFSAGEIVRSIF